MTTDDRGEVPDEPGGIFYLVAGEDDVELRATALEETFDKAPTIQARVSMSDLHNGDVYDEILQSAKVGSRWGKDLVEVYRDSVGELLDDYEEFRLVDGLERRYDEYQADAYEAELTGEAISIGIDVGSTVQSKLDDWSSVQFNKNDLAAAVGFAESEDVENWSHTGDIVIESEKAFSVLREETSLGRFVNKIQELVILDFRVIIVAPQEVTNEADIVKEIFQPLGQFTLLDETETAISVTNEVKSFVDEWYDRLCYEVSDSRLSKRTVRAASVTAYDLSDGELGRVFKRAINEGLQNKYSQNAFDKEEFEELWNDHVTPHENYYPYKSKRADFPDVTVARKDDTVRTFRLHHEGPQARPHLDGIAIDTDEPEKALIDLIVRFLDADHVSDDQWQSLNLKGTETVGDYLTENLESILQKVLLRRDRKRATIQPLISNTSQQHSTTEEDTEQIRSPEWYREHWPTILSGHEITKPFGTNIIADKRALQRSLEGRSAAESALYYKLERDIEEAWDVFVTGIQKEVQANLPDDLNTESNVVESSSGERIVFEVSTPAGGTLSTVVDVYLPYSDVRINDTPIKNATISKTVMAVLDTFEDVLYERSNGSDLNEREQAELLYQVIRFYTAVTECEEGDRIYFDDLIHFCQLLPGVWEQFKNPTKSVETSLREAFSNDELVRLLRDDNVGFHRKGSDEHGSIRTSENRFIAFDVVDELL